MDATIKQLIQTAHETAKEKGWWDSPRTFLECICLVHCELSEAVEEYRKNGLNENEESTKELAKELADVLIRIFDLCGYYNINLEDALEEKMAYNKTRPYRHGNKKA